MAGVWVVSGYETKPLVVRLVVCSSQPLHSIVVVQGHNMTPCSPGPSASMGVYALASSSGISPAIELSMVIDE